MGNYAVYLRKSRKDTELEKLGNGETLSRHRKILLEYSQKNNLNISCIFEEIVSGESISARPEMQKLLKCVEENLFDGVIVMEVERLARGDTLDQGIVSQSFKLTKTKIITPQKIYDPDNENDEEYFEFGLFMSRREYKTINRRLQAGRMASVKEGAYIGSIAPYGYDRIKRGKSWTLIENADAENVKLIFRLFTHNQYSIAEIVKHLDMMNITPQKSKNWSYSSIRDILSNHIYIGKICWNKRPSKKQFINGRLNTSRPRNTDNIILYDGLHNSIISDDIFEKAQSLLHKSKKNYTKKDNCNNCFAGIMKCKNCGKNMILKKIDKKLRLCCLNKGCETSSYDYLVIRDEIFKVIKNELGNIKITPQLIDDTTTDLSLINTKIQALKVQQNKLCDLLEQGIYTANEYFLRKKSLQEKENNLLQIHKNAAQNNMNFLNKNPISLGEIIDLLPITDVQFQNEFLSVLCGGIFYTREKSSRFHQQDITIEIKLKNYF